ncbi:hypothetical protein JAAARDRAFT_56397 [Jaapia argillacea MUCL 33604]|uniref:Uncharacterized protein n=1 Tax=Jaapia argillacea MUCL 33604 TaxID=933084 RepID=A0A067QD54_9AGAM|nr:hypothetical protein JAAARDRAFT_56397 [Jaapia argillacea MUCL 33604]
MYKHSHPIIKHLHIYADNYTALNSIVEPSSRAGQSWATSFQNTIMGFLNQNPEHTLAKDASELWCLDHPTLTNAKQMTKARALDDWTAEWKSHKFMGAFATANHIPPAWKPRDHFFTTKREVYARLTQCRTGHGFFGEYYSQFVPTETTSCSCGTVLQTRDHIIQEAFTKTGMPRGQAIPLIYHEDEVYEDGEASGGEAEQEEEEEEEDLSEGSESEREE